MKSPAFSVLTAMVASMAFDPVNVHGLHDRFIRRRDIYADASDADEAKSSNDTEGRLLHNHDHNYREGMMHFWKHRVSASSSSDSNSSSRRSNRGHGHGFRHHHNGSSQRSPFSGAFQGYQDWRNSIPKDEWNPMHHNEHPPSIPPPFPPNETDFNLIKMNFGPPQPRSTHRPLTEECFCEEMWDTVTCEKWESNSLTLSLTEEYCAENCCDDAEEIMADDDEDEIRAEAVNTEGEDAAAVSSSDSSSSDSSSSGSSSSGSASWDSSSSYSASWDSSSSDSASSDSASADSESPSKASSESASANSASSESASADSVSPDINVTTQDKYEMADVDMDGVEPETEPVTEDEQFVDELAKVKIIRDGDTPKVLDDIELEISSEQDVREEVEMEQASDFNN